MPFTTNFANEILDYALAKRASLNAPAAVYIGLCSNDPEEDGGVIVELSGGGYTRVMISQRGQAYPNLIGTATERTITSIRQINWTKAQYDWERINGFFLSSSETVGEKTGIFFFGKIELSEEDAAAGGLLVETGAVALFDPRSLTIGFSDTDAAVAMVSE